MAMFKNKPLHPTILIVLALEAGPPSNVIVASLHPRSVTIVHIKLAVGAVRALIAQRLLMCFNIDPDDSLLAYYLLLLYPHVPGRSLVRVCAWVSLQVTGGP